MIYEESRRHDLFGNISKNVVKQDIEYLLEFPSDLL